LKRILPTRRNRHSERTAYCPARFGRNQHRGARSLDVARPPRECSDSRPRSESSDVVHEHDKARARALARRRAILPMPSLPLSSRPPSRRAAV
jgi:hypothetical protein